MKRRSFLKAIFGTIAVAQTDFTKAQDITVLSVTDKKAKQFRETPQECMQASKDSHIHSASHGNIAIGSQAGWNISGQQNIHIGPYFPATLSSGEEIFFRP